MGRIREKLRRFGAGLRDVPKADEPKKAGEQPVLVEYDPAKQAVVAVLREEWETRDVPDGEIPF